MARITFLLAVAFCLVAVVVSQGFEQKTGFELKERHDFFNTHSNNPFSSGADAHMKTQSAKINHDFIGGKNWAAGAYVQHERKSMFGMTRHNNEGGFEVRAKF